MVFCAPSKRQKKKCAGGALNAPPAFVKTIVLSVKTLFASLSGGDFSSH